ncbi:MAG: protein TolQ [Thermodesulfobacteriota bacterium]
MYQGIILGLILAQNSVGAAGLEQINVVVLINNAGPVVKFVLVLLGFMSVMSWIIIFSKLLILRSAAGESEKFLNLYQSSANFGNLYVATRNIKGPSAELFRAGYTELLRIRKSNPQSGLQAMELKEDPEAVSTELGVVELVERVLKKTMSSEVSRLEGYLIFLATTGSTAPFIGLFGTVWGIMTSFIGLATKTGVSTLQAVAPGIAEALVATAVGLAAAIPAVVAYNYLINRVRRIEIDMESFSAEFLNIVERYFKTI